MPSSAAIRRRLQPLSSSWRITATSSGVCITPSRSRSTRGVRALDVWATPKPTPAVGTATEALPSSAVAAGTAAPAAAARIKPGVQVAQFSCRLWLSFRCRPTDLANSLAERFPRAAELLHQAREVVLAFRHFPAPHWRKTWSTNLLERVNEEVKRCTRVVGIFPNDSDITRLVGAVLLEQDEHWQLEGRRMFTAESMAAIPSPRWRICQPWRLPAHNGQHPGPGDRGRSVPTGHSGLDRRPGAGVNPSRRLTGRLTSATQRPSRRET